MAIKTYIGDLAGKARSVKKLYAGDANGAARELKSLYIGDASGIARKIFQKIRNFLVSLSVSPSGGGSVSGGGTYEEGTSVTVKAVPASGYKFSAWREGGASVSASASYTFLLSTNRALTALFTALPKGVVWKLSSMPQSAGWIKLAYGKGVFVALSTNYNVITPHGTSQIGTNEQIIAHSTDGINWTAGAIKYEVGTNGTRDEYVNIQFVGDRFMAMTKAGKRSESYDGITWTYIQVNMVLQGGGSNGTIYLANNEDGSNKIAVGTSSTTTTGTAYYYFYNGSSWGQRMFYSSYMLTFCAYGFGKFFLIKRNQTTALCGTDKNWSEITMPVYDGWIQYLYAGGKLIFISSTKLIYSTDGSSFKKATLPITSGISGIAYGNGKFVIIFSSSANRLKYMYSSDGINWTVAEDEMPANNSWRGVAYGNNRFSAIANSTINCGYAIDV